MKAAAFTGKKLSSLLLYFEFMYELIHFLQISAIRTRAYNVLRLLTISRNFCCDRIPLPTERGGEFGEVYVSPLMIASYLGDYKAADILIRSAGKKWKNVVLAKSSQGDDCLALAKEARDVAQLLYDDALAYEVEATSKKDRKKREAIVVMHAENLEMAFELVERLNSTKPLALKEKAREELMLTFMSMGMLAVAIVWKLCSS